MVDRFELSIEILNFLLQKAEFATTTEIHKYLYQQGLLESLSPRSKERRKLNRVLGFLESQGYIESKHINLRGRTPQEWKVNRKAFPNLAHLSEEELISLLTFMAFIPENYKKLSVFKPMLKLINRLSEKIDTEKRKLIENSFIYEPQFVERFIPFDDKNLKQIHNAILNKKALIVSYKRSNYFKLFPLKVFAYNGVLYVGGIDANEEYRVYYLGGLKIIEDVNETISEFLRNKYQGTNFLFEYEKPFIFGVKIPSKPAMNFFENPEIFPTQFFLQKGRDYYLVYLIGYTGSRFTSRFLVEEILEIIPPSMEIIDKAREVKLKSRFPLVTFNLKDNRKRFKAFMEEVEEFLNQRTSAVRGLKIHLL